MQFLDDVTLRGARRWCVVQGDCRQLLPLLWPGCAQVLITDFPYGLSEELEDGEKPEEISRGDDTKPIAQDFGPWDRCPLEELAGLIRETLHLAKLALHEHGAAYVFSSDLLFDVTRKALEENLLCQRVSFGAWCKTNPAPSVRKSGPLSAMELFLVGRRAENGYNWPGHHSADNWIQAPIPHYLKRQHPCEKPQEVLERFIRASSSPGDVVVDPCCGGAATGEAALRLGRRFVGFDLDPVHVAHAQRRLELLTQSAGVAVPPASSPAA